MDNLCHTLVGAALAEAGLRKKTPLATATLLIGANIPDVDGILYWLNRPIEALGLPARLDARRAGDGGLALRAGRADARVGPLGPAAAASREAAGGRRAPWCWLGLLAVLTHPLLDLCNTYGVRLLMPFSGHWFHGDTLFIIDPWMWLALGLGWLVARGAAAAAAPRGRNGRPGGRSAWPRRTCW